MHQHLWKVEDYSDSDPGIVYLKCECGQTGKGVLTKEHYDFWKDYYEDGTEELIYAPEADGLDEIISADADALGL